MFVAVLNLVIIEVTFRESRDGLCVGFVKQFILIPPCLVRKLSHMCRSCDRKILLGDVEGMPGLYSIQICN